MLDAQSRCIILLMQRRVEQKGHGPLDLPVDRSRSPRTTSSLPQFWPGATHLPSLSLLLVHDSVPNKVVPTFGIMRQRYKKDTACSEAGGAVPSAGTVN